MRTVRAFLLAVLAGAVATQAGAAVFIPMPVEDLTRSSLAVVIARVRATRGVVTANGQVSTLVDLDVEELLHGTLPASAVTLAEPGGQVGVIEERIDGMPLYIVGERVVAFLGVWPDGSLRTNHLALGKFSIDLDATGHLQARQSFGPGVTLMLRRGTQAPQATVPLDELRAAVARGRELSPAVPAGPSARAVPPAGTAGDGSAGGGPSPFVLPDPPVRFFEPDAGLPVNYLIDDRGDSILGLPSSRQAVDSALTVWTNVGTASISLADAGLTDNLNTGCGSSGGSRVLFDDPSALIPPPTACSGTLGVAVTCSTTQQTDVNGTTFFRVVKGIVVFADGWGGCRDWTQCNIAEVATHELGHTIGLDHSADPDATMFALAQFDDRCADVRTDDVAGVTFIYPTPSTSTTTSTMTTSTTTTTLPSPCASTPAPGCRLGAPLKSSIQIKDNLDDAKDRLTWTWNKGAATAVGDFADPVNGSAAYRVCLYDASLSPQPLQEARVFPGGTCGKAPCWKLLGKVLSPEGFKYKNKLGTPDGLTDLKLQAGVTGKAKVRVKGKGMNLVLPILGLTPPVTVQLLVDDGIATECWQTTFTTAAKNTSALFKAKGP